MKEERGVMGPSAAPSRPSTHTSSTAKVRKRVTGAAAGATVPKSKTAAAASAVPTEDGWPACAPDTRHLFVDVAGKPVLSQHVGFAYWLSQPGTA